MAARRASDMPPRGGTVLHWQGGNTVAASKLGGFLELRKNCCEKFAQFFDDLREPARRFREVRPL